MRRATTFVLSGLILALAVREGSAGNGEIAPAYPVDGIVIDGDLSDWPETAVPIPIARRADEAPVDADDFEASFRLGYEVSSGALLVGVRVQDDDHTTSSPDTDDWQSQDTHLLYIDRQHAASGSGVVLYVHADRPLELIRHPEHWDPANAEANWDDVKVVQRRSGTSTVYEWRVDLGNSLKPGTTIGLDHLLLDADAGETEGTLAHWGEGFAKSANAHRLGDVAVLRADQRVGRVQGQVRWEAPRPNDQLDRVRLTSLAQAELWFQAAVDDDGNYQADIPQGRYVVTPAYSLSVPFSSDFSNHPRRVRAHHAVEVSVAADKATEAPPLILTGSEPPDYLLPHRGVLADFDTRYHLALDAYVETLRRYYDIPGVAVAIVRDGQLAYHRTFGVTNNVTRAPVTDDTLFEAASITKPVFAFAVMRLAEQGILDLDKPLFEYLPFPNLEDDLRYKTITARLVLTHQTGLPNWPWGGPGTWEEGGKLQLSFAPGSSFGYSGEAFNYLGRVVEKLTGKTLAQVLADYVSAPMALNTTHYYVDDALIEKMALGHYHYFPHWKARERIVSPASSMQTSALDFSRFMIGLIERRGLKPETYEDMFRAQLVVPEDERVYKEDGEQTMGLGFFMRETPLGKLVEHGGNNGDFDCKFGVIPEAGLGYAVFTNSNLGDELTRAIERFLLHGRPGVTEL